MTWILLAAFVASGVWLYRQLTEAGSAKWRLRHEMHFRPMGRLIREDVRAIKRHMQTWRSSRGH